MSETDQNIDIFDLSDLSDLPETIKNEMNAAKRDEFEKRLIELLKMAARELNLDQIQAGYFRKYNETKERRIITTKLYNMARADNAAVTSIDGRKGVYKIKDGYKE